MVKLFKSKEEKLFEKIMDDRENWVLFGPKFLDEGDDYKETAMKLKDIYNSSENNALVNFLNNPENRGDFDGLFRQLSSSFLSSIVMVFDDSYIHPIVNGVSMVYMPTPHNEMELLHSSKDPKEISKAVNTHTYLVQNNNGKKYHMVFTNKKSLENTLRQNDYPNLHPQLSNFGQVAFNLISSENADGILLANNKSGIVISKQVLINNFEKIKSLTKDQELISLKSSLFIFDK